MASGSRGDRSPTELASHPSLPGSTFLWYAGVRYTAGNGGAIVPISGLVIVLAEDEASRAEALSAIERDQRISVGPRRDRRLAVVVETDSSEEDREVWDQLQALPGVAWVELAFASFDTEPSAATSPAPCHRPAEPARRPENG